MKSKKSIPRDSFIAKVRKPTDTDPLIHLQGFVGDAATDEYLRLYSDASLNEYVDIPENDVVHYEKIRSDQSPLGGYNLWLHKDAIFAYGDPEAKNRQQRKFFEGEIAAGLSTDVVGYTPASWYAGCNSGWHTCRSHFWTDCVFRSRFFNCPEPTIIVDRITTIRSAVDACPSALGCTFTDRIRNDVFEQVNPLVRRRFNDAGFGQFQP